MQNSLLIITKVYRLFLYTSFLLILLFIFSFYILDVTKKAQEVDIIVSLGGDGNSDRINKAFNLYKNNLSLSNKIIITGYNEKNKYEKIESDKRLSFLIKNGINIKNIDIAYETKDTMSELIYLMHYMTINDFESSIIVTDPPHSKRIELLLNILNSKKKFNIIIVSSEPIWWKDKINTISINFILSEYVKIPYNILKIFFYQSYKPINVN